MNMTRKIAVTLAAAAVGLGLLAATAPAAHAKAASKKDGTWGFVVVAPTGPGTSPQPVKLK